MQGMRNGPTHAWIERDGVIVDITADQFDDVEQAVIVTADRTWHDQFKGDTVMGPARIDSYDPRSEAELGGAYQLILADLAG